MKEALIELFIALAGLAITVITAYVIPWLKAKTKSTKYGDLIDKTYNAVRAMNQTIPPEEWERKKEIVKDYLMYLINKDPETGLTEYDIEMIIEGIVNKVKEEKAKGNS